MTFFKHHTFKLLIYVYIILITGNVNAAEFHVALFGNDGNPGHASAPFATLEKARNAARTLRARRPKEPITIWLHAGEYRINKVFELDSRDSGRAGAPLIIASSPNERVTISGATSLPATAFKHLTDERVRSRIINHDVRDKVLVADLKALGIFEYGELSRHGFGAYQRYAKTPPVHLYINGNRLTLARWPNPTEDYSQLLSFHNKARRGVVARSKIIDPGPTRDDISFNLRGGTFQVSFDRLNHWQQADDIWIQGIISESWQWSYNRIHNIDTSKRQITLAHGEIDGIKKSWVGDYFFIENLLEEIDQPGEWYLDRKKGLLYLLPPSNFSANAHPEIELVTLVTPMISLRNASHILFRDLLLEYGRDWAIIGEGGEGIRIEGTEIRHFSGGGVSLIGRHHGVAQSHLHTLGGMAISLNCGDKTTLTHGGCFALNNHIHDWGWYQKANTGAVNLDGVAQRVAHNHIHHSAQGAIYLSGNDHLIEYNDFHNLMLEFIDMGVVYGSAGQKPLERGHIIRRNYFHDIGQTFSGQHAVYPDNLVQGWTIEENIFARIGAVDIPYPGNHAININSANYITVRHNIFIDCPQPVVFNDHAARNILPRFKPVWEREITSQKLDSLPHSKRYPELTRFWQDNHAKPTHTRYERNLIWNPTQPLTQFTQRKKDAPFIEGAQDQIGTLQRFGNWQFDILLPTSDPGFIDPKNHNYEIKTDSELLRRIPGFPVFDHDLIGIQNP